MGPASAVRGKKRGEAMKNISGVVLLAIILTLVAVYALQPLNAGAVGLVAVMCMAISALLVKVFSRLMKGGKK